MSLFIYFDGVERASSVRLTTGFSTSSAAELGSVGTGAFAVDDPTGVLDFAGWKGAYIVETAASPTRVWTGFIGNQTISRGTERTGAGRVWTFDAVDVNWNLTRRAIRSADGKRPAETDLVRLTWLLAHASLSGLVYNDGLANVSTNPINLGEADYRGSFPMQVLADMSTMAGKTAWCRYNDSTGRVELFYDLNTATTDDSALRISNVLSDVDSLVTFAPSIDATLERSVENLYSSLLLEYQKGYLYTTLSATATAYAARDMAVSTERIGSTTTAQTYSNTVLAKRATPEEFVDVTIEVPRAKVNSIREGQRSSIKFSHLPGITAFSWWRVISKQVAQRENDDSFYVVRLRLSNRIQPPYNAGNPDNFPHVSGDTSILLTIESNTSTSVQTFNVSAGQYVYVIATSINVTWQGVSGWDISLSQLGANAKMIWSTNWSLATAGTPGTVGSTTIGTWTQGQAAPSWEGGNPSSIGVWQSPGYTGYYVASAGTYELHSNFAFVGYNATVRVIISSDGPGTFQVPSTPPSPAQPVGPETVVMVGAVGTTAYPYADGTLKVTVDGVSISSASVTQTSPTAGTFTLAWAPNSDETVKVTYLGR